MKGKDSEHVCIEVCVCVWGRGGDDVTPRERTVV